MLLKSIKIYNYLLLIFCREANVSNEESPYWYYCKDIDEPLMPTFLMELSLAFFEGNYEEALERICASRGTISDDGDKVVDKYSGFTIRYIQLDTSEGYDESGFKVVKLELFWKKILLMFWKMKKINQNN